MCRMVHTVSPHALKVWWVGKESSINTLTSRVTVNRATSTVPKGKEWVEIWHDTDTLFFLKFNLTSLLLCSVALVQESETAWDSTPGLFLGKLYFLFWHVTIIYTFRLFNKGHVCVTSSSLSLGQRPRGSYLGWLPSSLPHSQFSFWQFCTAEVSPFVANGLWEDTWRVEK